MAPKAATLQRRACRIGLVNEGLGTSTTKFPQANASPIQP